ncbi:unnamed protein product [Lactuca saligna]|uniref:Transposase MuDR plant domain-containing protein n=1 Tax=Lactuca saligna TaxID=75948 RepID=A0AA35ZK71_LACSI|nr:unnamed protein product [Lactuca saligna]
MERVMPPRRKQLEVITESAERRMRSSAEKISNGINTYVRPKLNTMGLLLLPNFDCRILFDLVKSKAKVFNSNISLSFQHPVHGYVMNILDEVDVYQLRNVISETKEIVHLYLEVFQGLVEQTEATKKVVPYNVENIVSDNVEDCPEEETVALNMVEEKNLYEFGRLTDKTISDGEESNEGWLEDEFTPRKKASDIFYGMPPIPDCPDPIVEPGPFHSLGPNDDMFVRQTYDNKQQLIFALSLKATREKFQFKTKHSNKNHYEVYCEIENCSWCLYAKRHHLTDEFEIRTFNNVHTYARKMPIIPLLEFFRHLSQEWCYKHRIEGGKRSTVLTEWVEKVVSKNEEPTSPTLVPKKQKKARKSSTTSGSNTKGKGKGTEGTQETLETHGTQEMR